MKRIIGTLCVGKHGFTIDLSNDFKENLHGNYELYINVSDIVLPESVKNTEQAALGKE